MKHFFPDKKALVVGAGGLGCYAVELLARCGVSLTVVDGDVFSKSNMNRQLYCVKKSWGENKAMVAAARAQELGSDATAVPHFFDEADFSLVKNCDVVLDCLDNVAARRLLQKACKQYAKPLFHAAINGDYGHVAVVMPEDDTLDKLYSSGEPTIADTYSAVPCILASLQTNLALRYLDGEPSPNGILLFDAVESKFDIIKV